MASPQPDGHGDVDRATVRDHVIALCDQFHDSDVLTVIEACSFFLVYVWTKAAEPAGMSFEDYASAVGEAMGETYSKRPRPH
jgi:hypothetical protein